MISTNSVEVIHDPTARTLETVHREVLALERKIETALEYQNNLSTDRFASVQKKFEADEAHRLELKDMAEKARIEQKEDSKVGVDAALTAQKEAVKEATIATNLANAKSESAMTKALDQVSQTFSAAIANSVSQIIDVKETVTAIDNFRRGGVDASSEKRLSTGLLVAIAAIGLSSVFSVVIVGVTLYVGLHK